jgi:hypothetical protein
MGRSNSDIYILTARSPEAQLPIQTLLNRNNIDIPLDNIITIGGKNVDISKDKKIVLEMLANYYDIVYFFDDNQDNINLANSVPGIKTRLVDWNK